MLLCWRRTRIILLISWFGLASLGVRCPGLDVPAYGELHDAGVDRYLNRFDPIDATAEGEWIRHTFDPEGGEGPVCLDGTPFSVYTRVRDPRNVMVFFAGGGACWSGVGACSIRSAPSAPQEGIFADSLDPGDGEPIENPFASWSMMYVSACDGSFFGGDNEVPAPGFAWGKGIRRHRGVRNATAALDLARDLVPRPERVLLAGTSAGGYGVEGVIPLIARFEWLNFTRLYLFSDSGPAVYNLADTSAVQARVEEWAYTQFYPASCADCTPDRQPAELLAWLLARDDQVRSALYTTDGDAFVRYYLNLPTAAEYRELVLGAHDPIHAAYPERHKRFIRGGSVQHGALSFNFYYFAEIDGVPLREWLRDFVDERPGWVDLVEAPAPTP